MKVLIHKGFGSGKPAMRESQHYPRFFGIESEMVVAPARRNPEEVREPAIGARPRGYGVIIAAAGKKAALPGMVPAYTSLPVPGGRIPAIGNKNIAERAEAFKQNGYRV